MKRWLETLKKRIQNHPFFTILAGIISVSGITYTITSEFSRTRHEALQEQMHLLREKLNSELSGIPRDIDGSQYINIHSILLELDKNDTVIAGADYHPEIRAYTAKLPDGWKFEVVNDSLLNKELTGYPLERADYRMNKELDDTPQYHWRSNARFTIDSGSVFRNVFPSILLRKYDYSTTDYTFYIADEDGKRQVDTSDTLLYSMLNWTLTNDFAGFTLMTSLNRAFRVPLTYSDRMSSRVISAEKKGNTTYTQTLWVLHDGIVNGKRLDEFYIRIEEINILTNEGIAYQISIMTPSEDPMFQSSDNAYISTWLSKLRIVERGTINRRLY